MKIGYWTEEEKLKYKKKVKGMTGQEFAAETVRLDKAFHEEIMNITNSFVLRSVFDPKKSSR